MKLENVIFTNANGGSFGLNKNQRGGGDEEIQSKNELFKFC